MHRRTLGLLSGLALGYGLARWLSRPLPLPERVAHRGGAADAPENTLASFRNAMAAGIPNWELDVQLTADETLVVFHDETLDRTTDGQGPLAGHTLAELKRLDAGSWFGPEWRGERIPTLTEVIALARSAPDGGARLVIEIKSPHLYPGIEECLLDLLRAENFMDQVLIMSFDGDSLERVRELAPELPLCYLTGEDSFWPQEPPANAEIIGPKWQLIALNPLVIVLAHRAGRQVFTWTVNSDLGLRWLRLWGVDGITSDRLDLLQSIR